MLDDGTYYIGYEATPYPSGVWHGTMHAAHGSFTSSNAKDYSETFRDIFDIAVDGTYATRGHLNGTVRYPATGQTATFTGSYDKDYERTPTLAALAGTYLGDATTLHVVESLTIEIAASGAIHGTGASGCKFTGVASPPPQPRQCVRHHRGLRSVAMRRPGHAAQRHRVLPRPGSHLVRYRNERRSVRRRGVQGHAAGPLTSSAGRPVITRESIRPVSPDVQRLQGPFIPHHSVVARSAASL